MMTSLMSIFDPSMSFPHMGWVVAAVGVAPLKNAFWKAAAPAPFSFKMMVDVLHGLFKTHSIVFVALFLFILNMNLAGLLPLVFSPTSHLSFNMTLSLTLWLGMMLYYVWSSSEQLLVHLTPVGSPLPLAPALVLIELVSSLIRPVTLSLRLMANVMAGHMILTLISKGVFLMNPTTGIMLFLVLAGFLVFELGVALIQAYVFSSLMALYWEESDSSH